LIHVAKPVLNGNERKYVLECLDANQLSMGPMVARFEQAFAEYVGTRYAVAVSSGTAALHLALLALGVGPGDEVIVPALSFVATANAVRYCGATPVFVDVKPDTWCIDTEQVKASRSERTKAILPVSLYGHPVDWGALVDIAGRLPFVEDAAEALGARFHDRIWPDDMTAHVGSLSELACFSFYANKLITTGEGGMITTDDSDLVTRLRSLRGQGQHPERRYWHTELGYNYRMTDLQAAVGLGQLENIDWHLERRREVAHWYHTQLEGVTVQLQAPWAVSSNWMVAVLLPENRCPSCVAEELLAKGIETRPVFPPLHTLPMYNTGQRLPVAEDISRRGLVLPTHANLTEADVQTVCDALAEVIA
jgi:perosamine synthetase